MVIRWVAFLQRIAALYARGRFSVRPVQAEQMPPEIRELAETLEDMADAIVGRDASLRESLAQKDELMREIHHRVKNNLQVISSLLNMQQRALADPAARSAMSDTRQRITALALIYRALYQGPDLKRVDLRPFLEELTAQLVSGELHHGLAVRTELTVDHQGIDGEFRAHRQPVVQLAGDQLGGQLLQERSQVDPLQVGTLVEGAVDEGERGDPLAGVAHG